MLEQPDSGCPSDLTPRDLAAVHALDENGGAGNEPSEFREVEVGSILPAPRLDERIPVWGWCALRTVLVVALLFTFVRLV